MIRYNKGVDPFELTKEMRFWIPHIYSAWHDMFAERDMVITNGLDSYGAHAKGEAIDLRRYVEYGVTRYVEFCRKLQRHHGVFLGVQLEPEWGKGENYTAPHIHIQLK